jgi:DNA modification methylase
MDRNWDGREKNFSKGKPMMNLHHDILKQKDLIGIPWRVAFALQADGWYLRQDIIWHKPNPMPESVKDRFCKSHEYLFLLAKNQKYYFNNEAIQEPISESYANDKRPHGILRQRFYTNSKYIKSGMIKLNKNDFPKEKRAETRNKRSVWTITTKPYKEAHFATYPPELVTPCVLAGSREGDVVLDPFIGSGTTAYVAKKLGRQYLGIELNPEYVDMANKRLTQLQERLL